MELPRPQNNHTGVCLTHCFSVSFLERWNNSFSYPHQGNEKSGPIKLEFETTRENYVIVCSAPGNDQIVKTTEWKMDGQLETPMTEDSLKAAGES